jgi:hypothetical protein
MARIIPDISGAFGMQRPHLQKFRRPQAPKRSGAQEAADIMSLIQSGVGTAAGLYGLGRGIYEDFRETDEEAVARLQREAIAQGRRVARPLVRIESRDPRAMSQTTPMRHFPSAQPPEMTQEQMLESIAMGISPEQQKEINVARMRGALDEPSYAPSVAPTREEVVALAEDLPARMGGGQAPFVTEAIERAQPAATPDTPENRAIVQKAVDAAPTPEAKRALVDRVRAEGQSAIDKIAAHFGWTAEDIESLDPLQRAGLQLKGQELERAREQAERALPSAVTAREFLDRSFEGEQFNISDLASSYGGLMARGKEAEARELLRLARGAGDYASFITNPNEPPSLVEARARDAIKKGALAQPADVALTAGDLWEAVGGKRGRKGRKATPTPSRKKKPPAGTFKVGGVSGFTAEEKDDDVFVLVALARGLPKARSLAKTEDEKGQPKLSQEAERLKKGGGALSARTKKRLAKWNSGWQTSVSTDAAKRAEEKVERSTQAAEATAAAQAKRAKTDAEKAANKKKETHKKSLAVHGIDYDDAVKNPGHFATTLKARRTKVKANITDSQNKLSGNEALGIFKVKGPSRRSTLVKELKDLKAELATLTRAINTLNDIDQTPATFEPPAAIAVPTD